MPKFYLLYFKNLLDVAVINFFKSYSDYFKKIDDRYVLLKDVSKTKMLQIFRSLILNELANYVSKYNRLQPRYYFIIGSCLPKDNLLLEFKENKYFPKKIEKLLESKYNIKYLLKERDIDINILRFNDVCIDLSNALLTTDLIIKQFGKDYRNVIFIQHNQLDCYVLFKVLKFIYGKNNCINIYKEKMNKEKLPLIAINDIIDKHINKTSMNKSLKLKTITEEIQQYIDEKIKKL